MKQAVEVIVVSSRGGRVLLYLPTVKCCDNVDFYL